MDILGGAPNSQNPRGWFNGANIDYVSPSGMIVFSNALMARASEQKSLFRET